MKLVLYEFFIRLDILRECKCGDVFSLEMFLFVIFLCLKEVWFLSNEVFKFLKDVKIVENGILLLRFVELIIWLRILCLSLDIFEFFFLLLFCVSKRVLSL